ncbi:MAG: hypothetical protein KBG15_02970 [Kofleriaceae bacterium]|nr:hypothetical protein [Kofleriaceae bacterium]
MSELAERLAVLRDEVLDTAEHGDREPPGGEVFEAIVRALSVGGESVPGLDLALHEAAARRLAWGDTEEAVLADAEQVFDRLIVAAERAFREPLDQLLVVEAATQVAASVARVVAMHAVHRGSRDRSSRLREEMTQRQLRDALEKQQTSIERLQNELATSDFR